MTNRAHHPADRGSGEFASDGSKLTGAGEPGASAADEAVSREVVLPPHAEGGLARNDDDVEDVVPEPDAADGLLAVPNPEGGEAASEPSIQDVSEAAATPLEPTPNVPPAVSNDSPAGQERAAQPLDLASTQPVDLGILSSLGAGASQRDRSEPDRPTPPPLPVAATPAAPAVEQAPEGSRRGSRPPPLVPALSARELEPPRGAFTGSSPVEFTAAELESAASADAAGAEGPRASGEERSFRAPWVDEVPDPVTPYEQRVSETVKVADLPPVEQLRGRVLANRYLAEEVAEHTACSISYRAYHLALDRAVTVRVLLRGLACADDACQEVRRVAAGATALEHPHVASTLDFGVLSDGWPFVVTEHFQGNTLATISSREGKFVLRRVLHVGKQLAQGLSAAHEKGFVHGLLCPDNVLVVEPGSSAEVAKILGFGISKARGSQPGPPRSGVFGVPFYVSPEQAACRPIDERSDIYSLGVILYELMTGSPPFSDGDFAGVLCQHLDEDAPSPSTRLPSPGALAKALDAIIERCLRKEPEQRYQKAAELADDLVRLEAAAARTKRRPMPEVQKPTTTIHSPHPKAEAPEVPGAKVIVHDDLDDVGSPEPPEVAARRSSPSLTRSSPAAARSSGAPAAKAGSSATPGTAGAGGKRSSSPPPPAAGGSAPRPHRVRVDQATIKISAVDRERILAERQSGRGSWLSSVMAAIRRLLATQPGSGDDSR